LIETVNIPKQLQFVSNVKKPLNSIKKRFKKLKLGQKQPYDANAKMRQDISLTILVLQSKKLDTSRPVRFIKNKLFIGN